jgi:aspartate/methionine/tyrosine aminotransferase
MKTADRVSGLKPSPVRMLMDGAPAGSSPLGLGEPSWDLPEPARRALARAGDGVCAYGPNNGIPELRAAISARYGAGPDDALVVAGSQAALFAIYHAYLQPGTAVARARSVLPGVRRRWRSSRALPSRRTRCAPTAAGGSTRPRSSRRSTLRPDVRVAVVGAPANPTGAGVDAEDLRRVAEACAARDVLLDVRRGLPRAVPRSSRARTARRRADGRRDLVGVEGVGRAGAARGLDRRATRKLLAPRARSTASCARRPR